MFKPTRKHRLMIFVNSKWVESLATYYNHPQSSWGEFVSSLRTVEDTIEWVQRDRDFDTAQEYADHCEKMMERAAVRYERIRTQKRDAFQLRSLVEAMSQCYNWYKASEFFADSAATDRIEAGLMEVHESPYTTGYYGEF